MTAEKQTPVSAPTPMSSRSRIKVAAAVCPLRLGDCRGNAEALTGALHDAQAQGVDVLVTPVLSLTGASCRALYGQRQMIDDALAGLRAVVTASEGGRTLCFVGLPLADHDRLYSVMAAVRNGLLLGLVPLPTHGFDLWTGAESTLRVLGDEVPVSASQLFGEDWDERLSVGVAADNDSDRALALLAQGAQILVNPSAQPTLLTRYDKRVSALRRLAAQWSCAIVSANAGGGESTDSCVYGGERVIVQNGALLARAEAFTTGLTVAVLDAENELPQPAVAAAKALPRKPFVPSDLEALERRVDETLAIQAHGLARRLAHVNARPVLGLSGGVDSTVALLVILRALDIVQRPHSDALIVTMPGAGTSTRTRGNVDKLADALGLSLREIDINDLTAAHLSAIGHNGQHDVTFENAQARIRIQLLLDLANAENGLVVGPGDLSELALGFTTFGGDLTAHYAVNAGLPKTFLQAMLAVVGRRTPALAAVLADILDTPISPELVPNQQTEQQIGSYELNDFFLYHVLRSGWESEQLLSLAEAVFAPDYDRAALTAALQRFYRRLLSAQFKRNVCCDGPQVGSIALTGQGALVFPSDAYGAL